VTPSDRPEAEGAAPMAKNVLHQLLRIVELHIDRAQLNSRLSGNVIRRGCEASVERTSA
jgi:hypothetical protein